MLRTVGSTAFRRAIARLAAVFSVSLLIAGTASAALAQPQAIPLAPTITYADAVSLVERSSAVALVEIRDQALVEPERSPGLGAGRARMYLEGRTQGLLWGRAGLGEDVVFLADVPLLPNGKPPKLKKQRWLVFANPVANRPGTLQLAAPDSFTDATPANEQLARKVIAALAAPGAAPAITGVRDVMSVAGNLAGESETQLFLNSKSGDPVALTVIRRPGMDPQWGVSWSEIVDQAARAPERDTIAWYRLACSLPRQLPANAYLQQESAARLRVESDYRFILEQLGECTRSRG